MLDIYIEALLADEEFADEVWEAWNKGDINDQVAISLWLLVLDDHGCYRVGRLTVRYKDQPGFGGHF